VTTSAPASGAFRWAVPGMSGVSLDFPAGNYVAGDQYTVATNRTISRVNANAGPGAAASPAIAVAPSAQAQQIAAPPTGNTATASSGNTTNAGTPNNSGGSTAVGIDVNIDYSMTKLQQS